MNRIAFDWDLTSKINRIASTPFPWLTKLEEIASVILQACESDAIWILTLPPLRVAASGLLRTPLDAEPSAVIALSDASPPISKNWPPDHSLLSQVLKTGEPQFGTHLLKNGDGVDHDLGDVLFRFEEIDVQALVPIGIGEDCYGVMIIGNRQGKSLVSDDMGQILKQVGQHLALTLQNASLFETAQHQARQLAILNRIARTITSSLDLDEVLQLTLSGIDEILDVEAGAILLLDEKTNDLYFKILLRGAENIPTSLRLKVGEGIAGWVFQQQKPALVNDALKDPRFSRRVDNATGFITKSVLCTPLVVNGRAIGSVEVLNKQRDIFTLDDQVLLTSMTASLAVALHNSSLYQQMQEQIKQMEQINNLASEVKINLSFAETTEALVAELHKYFEFDDAILGLLDEHRMTVENTVLDRRGLSVAYLPPIPVGDSYIRHVMTRQNESLLFDVSQSLPFAERAWFEERGIKSFISILLKLENSEFGIFSIASQIEKAFSTNDIRRLTQLSPTLSATLEKARLLDAMERKTVELEELNLLGERLLTNTDPEFILDTTLKYVPRLLPAAVHGLILIDSETVNIGLRLPENATQALIDQICEEMIEALQNSLHDQRHITPTEIRTTFENKPVSPDWRPQSKLAWPILTLRGSLGVVYLAYQEISAITADRMRLFSLVVSRISGTIENSRLFMEIEQERARLAAILRSTPDGIVVVSKTGRVILDNPAANQILHHATSQAGQLLADVTDHENLFVLFKRAEKSGSAAGEFTTLEDKTYYTSVSPVETIGTLGHTSVIGWVAVMQDVTHFKELNDAKDSFVNAVSHDLRSPLGGITLASQLLPMTGPLTNQQQQFLKTIQDHINNMTKLIDDLLDVGKIEAGIDMQMEAHVVASRFMEVVDRLRAQAEQKELTLIVNLQDPAVEVQGNPLRLQQIFSNLIGNAIKYTPKGGEIKVSLSRQDDYLLFQVSDNGVGIPQADQPHIFEKFYRVKGEHMTGIKGSGLGLAITKSIVEKHQGTIWVDSKFKGGGSTFSVLLPILK